MPMTKLLKVRWLAEIAKMRNTFAQFEPFVRDGFFGDVIGFTGQLQARSGKDWRSSGTFSGN